MLFHYVKLRSAWRDLMAQDLIEYALVVALIALAATAGMGAVATAVNAGFTTIANKISSYTT